MSAAALEARCRRRLAKLGCGMSKSRRNVGTYDNQGGFMIYDASLNTCLAGPRFDYDLDDVVAWLDYAEKEEAA